jgi:hypothetical protein
MKPESAKKKFICKEHEIDKIKKGYLGPNLKAVRYQEDRTAIRIVLI